MQNLKYLGPYLKQHASRIVAGLILMAVSTGLSVIQPRFVGDAINSLRHPSLGHLTFYVGLILAAAILQALFSFLQRSALNRVSRLIEYELRNDCFTHLQSLEQRFYQEMHTGDLMARLTNDLSAVRQFIGMGLTNMCMTFMMLVVVSVLMVTLSWKLALIAFIVLPFTTVSVVVLGRVMQRRFRLVQDQFGRISTQAQENFSGIRVIKAFAQEDREIAAFSKANSEYVRLNLSYVRLSGLMWPIMRLVVGLALALVLFVGGLQVINGSLSLGGLVQFTLYLGMLTWPMVSLGYTINQYQQGAASMGRIIEVLHRNPAIADSGRTLPLEEVTGKIEFRNVGVRYDDRWVFRNVSFTVEPGSTTAIIGMTGAGKTTLMSLVPRILEADEGQVLVDGVDVRRIPLDTLRRAVGHVPQDNFLFSATLRENVSFGVDHPSDEALWQAVEISQLGRDLEQFSNGLDTVVGERGVSLSGGQKQRTALARAIMRNPSILILDDAMSSVDTHTQAEILRGLQGVMAHRTTLITAMRISTIKNADQIVVLHDGGVAEIGSHQELLNADGLYAKMYRRELLQQELEVEEGEEVEA
ncbi:MAG TPA: ABC transporter ATP-binding protein [Chloroflexota bacterium]|nr:ABC transporter ATP-binding protein [Chloroflexota bacterium]